MSRRRDMDLKIGNWGGGRKLLLMCHLHNIERIRGKELILDSW
jgi:hypothetical protein